MTAFPAEIASAPPPAAPNSRISRDRGLCRATSRQAGAQPRGSRGDERAFSLSHLVYLCTLERRISTRVHVYVTCAYIDIVYISLSIYIRKMEREIEKERRRRRKKKDRQTDRETSVRINSAALLQPSPLFTITTKNSPIPNPSIQECHDLPRPDDRYHKQARLSGKRRAAARRCHVSPRRALRGCVLGTQTLDKCICCHRGHR